MMGRPLTRLPTTLSLTLSLNVIPPLLLIGGRMLCVVCWVLGVMLHAVWLDAVGLDAVCCVVVCWVVGCYVVCGGVLCGYVGVCCVDVWLD